jgi:hypothetical protein
MATYFGADFTPAPIGNNEDAVIQEILKYVNGRFNRMKYILSLALDFSLLARQIVIIDKAAAAFQPDLSRDDLFSRYTLITEKAGRTANTLTLRFQDDPQQGIRKL